MLKRINLWFWAVKHVHIVLAERDRYAARLAKINALANAGQDRTVKRSYMWGILGAIMRECRRA